MVNHKHYTYRVTWSEEDQEYVGLCAEFPSLSFLDENMSAALDGIVELVGEVVADMNKNGEPILELELKNCFVMAPIGDEGSEYRIHSDTVREKIIEPALRECGYKYIRADQVDIAGMIPIHIIEHISADPLAIVDLSYKNPNVVYELALRHTLRKPVIHIIKSGEKIPFDLEQYNTLIFDLKNTEAFGNYCQKVVDFIREIELDPNRIYNPISSALDVIGFKDVAPLTRTFIERSFQEIPELQKQYGRDVYHFVTQQFFDFGIRTQGDLRELLNTPGLLDTLRKLYREELLRSDDELLDPSAISRFGSILYLVGVDKGEIIVRNQIREYPEYKNKHPDQ